MTHDRAAKPTIREIVYNWWSPTQPGTTSIHDKDALVSQLEYREMQWPERAPEPRYQGLVEKWREEAKRPRVRLSDAKKDALVAEAAAARTYLLNACADELEAALTRGEVGR